MREVETAWKKDATLKEALRTMMPQLGQNSPVVGELKTVKIHVTSAVVIIIHY